MQFHSLSRYLTILDTLKIFGANSSFNSRTFRSNELTPLLFFCKAESVSNKGTALSKFHGQVFEQQILVFTFTGIFNHKLHSILTGFIPIRLLSNGKTNYVFPVPQFRQFGQNAFGKKVCQILVDLRSVFKTCKQIMNNLTQLATTTRITSTQNTTNSSIMISIQCLPEQITVQGIALSTIIISAGKQIKIYNGRARSSKLSITISSLSYINFFVEHFHFLF